MTDISSPSPAAPAFVNAAARRRSVKLQWPLEYDGRVYDEICVRRLTVAEVAAWVEGLKAGGENPHPHMPIYVDAAGAPIPDVVIDALDDDDGAALDEVVRDFLPRRFRGLQDSASGPADGGNSAPI